MTPEELAEIEERARKATPGPWSYCGAPNCSCGLVWEGSGHFTVAITDSDPDGECIIDTTERKVRDGQFIAAARADVPALCADNRALRARAEKAEAEVARLREALDAAQRIVKRKADREAGREEGDHVGR